MNELIVGLFAVSIGVIFCFFGYKTMRIIFPLWGIVAGYWVGAEMVRALTNGSFMATTMSIVVGVALALVGAVLAYAYFAVSVILFMGLVGFWLGAGFIQLVGFKAGILSTLLGIFFAFLFILGALIGNAPKVYLLLVTSFAGSALAVSGMLLVLNLVKLSDFDDGSFAVVAGRNWFWVLVMIVVGLIGLSSQLTHTQNEELTWEAEWSKGKVAS